MFLCQVAWPEVFFSTLPETNKKLAPENRLSAPKGKLSSKLSIFRGELLVREDIGCTPFCTKLFVHLPANEVELFYAPGGLENIFMHSG